MTVVRLRLLLLCILLPLAATARGQDPQGPATTAPTTPAAISAQLDAVTNDETLTAELKTSLQETLRRALDSARRAETNRKSLEKFVTAKNTVGERLPARQNELAALDKAQPGPPRTDLPLAELEQGTTTAQGALAAAQQQVVDLEQEATRRGERRTAIPARLTEVQRRLDALPTSLPEVPEIDTRLRTAQRLALTTERQELTAEVAALQAELQSYDAESELQRVERNLAARRVTTSKANADAWQEVLQAARTAAARQAERDAQQAQLNADARVAKLAKGNADLAAEATKLTDELAQAEKALTERNSAYTRLQEDFAETKKRAELVGMTEAIGALLRQRRMTLTDVVRRSQIESRNRTGTVAETQLRLLEYGERSRRLIEDPERWLTDQLADVNPTAELPPDVLAEAQRLREARAGLLDRLTRGYERLLATQIELASVERNLAERVTAYRNYVTERVLSIRSSKPIWNFDWAASSNALAWFSSVPHWQELVLVADAALRQPIWPLFVTALVLLLMAMQRTFAARMVKHGELAARGTTVTYVPTALSAVDALVLSLPLPGLLLLTGALLGADGGATDFVKAFGAGLERAGWNLLPVVLLRQVLRPKGLAESHFQWQTTTVAKLRSIVPLLLSAVPMSFALGVLEATGDDNWLGSLGAVVLAAQLALLLIAFWRLLHPSTGIMGTTVQGATGALHRFRRLWFFVGVGTPAALLTMVTLGYDYTALQLTRRMLTTFGAVLAAALIQAMILRSLVLERRRLQIRRMKERMEAAKAGEAPNPETVQLEQIDPGSLARQTQTLVRWSVAVVAAIVLFQIWVDVLPALGILRQVRVWPTLDADGSTSWITLADIAASAFVLLASAAAARNLPALLELFVLQRTRMQPGERHAITTLARYGIVVVGLVLAFTSIGIGWSKVQWLVAAVSVGLGFGLQEIFANFVSGLILLIERPIRVGDVVQIGGTTGRVSRIQIRATTIVDWERKELVVPNREFVTGQFVNWTLADGVIRRTIKVGIAYGSNTARALELLVEVARRSEVALKEPPPEAIFVGFGDSTLDLELRIFVDQLTLDLRLVSKLLVEIDMAFRKEGIEIAFPQRDVHLDLSPATVDLLQRQREREPEREPT